MSNDSQPNSLLIPKTNNDITKDWILQATGLQPIDNSITINDNIQDGVGFLSNLCRVSFQTESGSDESILVKLLPDNPEFRAMTIDQEFDQREIQFYSLAYPQIVEVVPELKNNFCKFYGGKQTGEGDEYVSMLIIEDLKPMGYQMLNPESEKWKENLGKIIKFIAELNAAGLALKTAKPGEFSKIVSFCMGANEKEKTGMLFELGKANSVKLEELFVKHNCPQEMINSYNELSKQVEDILSKTFSKGEKFPCLIHGDIWPPNVMVNESSPKSHMKVVDWQLLGFRDPCCELSVAILSCLPQAQLNKVTVDMFLKMYWREFIEACRAKGHDYKERNEEEFIQFFNTWGMAFGYYWWILSFDSFPNDQDRLCKAFEVIYEEYKIPQFLLNDHLNSS